MVHEIVDHRLFESESFSRKIWQDPVFTAIKRPGTHWYFIFEQLYSVVLKLYPGVATDSVQLSRPQWNDSTWSTQNWNCQGIVGFLSCEATR